MSDKTTKLQDKTPLTSMQSVDNVLVTNSGGVNLLPVAKLDDNFFAPDKIVGLATGQDVINAIIARRNAVDYIHKPFIIQVDEGTIAALRSEPTRVNTFAQWWQFNPVSSQDPSRAAFLAASYQSTNIYICIFFNSTVSIRKI